MKFVIDTNMLFSFFKPDSFTKKLINNSFFELISPDYALIELKKYANLIIKKNKISKNKFNEYLNSLKQTVKFLPQKDYTKFLSNAKEITPDIKDADFLALCLKENSILWSNDNLLKNQDKVKVLSTEEIVRLIF